MHVHIPIKLVTQAVVVGLFSIAVHTRGMYWQLNSVEYIMDYSCSCCRLI